MAFISGFDKTADVKTLGKIYSNFRKDPNHLGLYNSLVNQAKKYKGSIDRLERTSQSFYQHGRGSSQMVEAADRGRHMAHEAFMSDLTSVTRNAAKRGIDVQKMAPVLQDRSKATDFALELSRRFRPIEKVKRAA